MRVKFVFMLLCEEVVLGNGIILGHLWHLGPGDSKGHFEW